MRDGWRKRASSLRLFTRNPLPMKKSHFFFFFLNRWPVALRAVQAHLCTRSQVTYLQIGQIYFPLHITRCRCAVLERRRTLFKPGSLCRRLLHTHLCPQMFQPAGKHTLSGCEMRRGAPISNGLRLFKQRTIFLPPDEGPVPSHAHTYVECACVSVCVCVCFWTDHMVGKAWNECTQAGWIDPRTILRDVLKKKKEVWLEEYQDKRDVICNAEWSRARWACQRGSCIYRHGFNNVRLVTWTGETGHSALEKKKIVSLLKGQRSTSETDTFVDGIIYYDLVL